MRSIVSLRQLQHTFFIALPLSITLLFLFPAHSHAQAVLLRSDPIQNAALNSTPTRVRMWFSDNLNPSNSAASVVNNANQRIDLNRSGPNTFRATVFDNHGVKAANVNVSIYATMLDMDMGTISIKLQPDGKGHFSAIGNLDMGGKWGLRVEIRGPNLKLHEANAKIVAAN